MSNTVEFKAMLKEAVKEVLEEKEKAESSQGYPSAGAPKSRAKAKGKKVKTEFDETRTMSHTAQLKWEALGWCGKWIRPNRSSAAVDKGLFDGSRRTGLCQHKLAGQPGHPCSEPH